VPCRELRAAQRASPVRARPARREGPRGTTPTLPRTAPRHFVDSRWESRSYSRSAGRLGPRRASSPARRRHHDRACRWCRACHPRSAFAGTGSGGHASSACIRICLLVSPVETLTSTPGHSHSRPRWAQCEHTSFVGREGSLAAALPGGGRSHRTLLSASACARTTISTPLSCSAGCRRVSWIQQSTMIQSTHHRMIL